MKLLLKIIAALLLLFNGAGAIYGGGSLVLHPDGSGLHISTDWLQHSPFTDFFIPGVILFVANGLFSFFVLIFLLFDRPFYPRLVIAQGVILSGWIFIQVLLLQEWVALHWIMGATGIALFGCGLLLAQQATKTASAPHP